MAGQCEVNNVHDGAWEHEGTGRRDKKYCNAGPSSTTAVTTLIIHHTEQITLYCTVLYCTVL